MNLETSLRHYRPGWSEEKFCKEFCCYADRRWTGNECYTFWFTICVQLLKWARVF